MSIITTEDLDEIGNAVLIAVDDDLAEECQGCLEVRNMVWQTLSAIFSDDVLDQITEALSKPEQRGQLRQVLLGTTKDHNIG